MTTSKTLRDLEDYRDAIRAELATMSDAKIGTAWHTDRVDALWLTLNAIGRLTNHVASKIGD